MAFIVTARKKSQVAPVVRYLSRSGLVAFTTNNVATFKTVEAARAERDYFNTASPEYSFTIERVPAGRDRFLRAVEVE